MQEARPHSWTPERCRNPLTPTTKADITGLCCQVRRVLPGWIKWFPGVGNDWKGARRAPSRVQFLDPHAGYQECVCFVKIHQTRALCTRLDAPDSSTPSFVLKKCLLQAAMIFHCLSHVTPCPSCPVVLAAAAIPFTPPAPPAAAESIPRAAGQSVPR